MRQHSAAVRVLAVTMLLMTTTEYAKPSSTSSEEQKVARFCQNLTSQTRALQGEIAAVKREMAKRQERERKQAARYVRDERAIRETGQFLANLRQAIVSLRDPSVSRINVSHVKIYGSGVQIKDPVPFLTIDRQNAPFVLVQAEQAYQAALAGRWVLPPDLLDRHNCELRQCVELETGPFAETRMLMGEASRSIRGMTRDHRPLRDELAKWENRINVAAAQTYDAIAELAKGESPVVPARPIGFFMVAGPSDPSGGSRRQQTLVVVVVLGSKFFTATQDVHQPILEETSNSPSAQDRSRLWVLDPKHFTLVLKNGERVSANGAFEPETCGGEILVNAENQCIIRCGPDHPSQISLRLAWLLDAQDCASSFRIQVGDSPAVDVPSCRLDPGGVARANPRVDKGGGK
jgi:hypothetical protein